MNKQKMEEKMKKIIRPLMFALALVMLLAVGMACAGQETGSESDNQSPGSPPTNTPDNNAGNNNEPTPPPVDLTVASGLLIMATNAEFPPYEFWEGGKIVGIDAEIAGAIADKLGLTLQIDDMEFSSILAAVTSGRADMAMAGLTITEDRKLSVDFSTSYATGVQVIIVRENSPIKSVDDLFDDDAFFDIGVQESTTGDLYTSWDLEDEGLATIHRYRRGADAVQALVTGRVDCVVIDNEPAKAFVEMNPGLVILETEFAVEDYAIAFAKGSALRDAVDEILVGLIADGTVQRIVDKYITLG